MILPHSALRRQMAEYFALLLIAPRMLSVNTSQLPWGVLFQQPARRLASPLSVLILASRSAICFLVLSIPSRELFLFNKPLSEAVDQPLHCVPQLETLRSQILDVFKGRIRASTCLHTQAPTVENSPGVRRVAKQLFPEACPVLVYCGKFPRHRTALGCVHQQC